MLHKVATRPVSRQVAVTVQAPEPREARVTGEFTGRAEQGLRLKQGGGGLRRSVATLKPGAYQYRLLIDGAWKEHEEAGRPGANPYGVENCIPQVL